MSPMAGGLVRFYESTLSESERITESERIVKWIDLTMKVENSRT